jgi:hypothetical protein
MICEVRRLADGKIYRKVKKVEEVKKKKLLRLCGPTFRAISNAYLAGIGASCQVRVREASAVRGRENHSCYSQFSVWLDVVCASSSSANWCGKKSPPNNEGAAGGLIKTVHG